MAMKCLLTLTTLSLHILTLLLPSPSAAVNPSTNTTRFTIDSRTAYFAGTNAYWLPFLTSSRDVDLVLDHIAASGLKILRTWGFNDVTSRPSSGTVYFQLLSASISEINTGANGLQRLDYVVQSAAKRGVKLIIPLVNNWGDYGGMPAYVSTFGGPKEGWYTNARAQAQYKRYVEAVVKRYAGSEAIFAWELANEPRCKGCATDVIYKWASETAAFIRGLDPRHLITLGDEGFGLPSSSGQGGSYPHGTSEGVDFVKNLGIKDLDFGTFHFYPKSCKFSFHHFDMLSESVLTVIAGGVANTFGPGWVKDHAAACKKAGKPCLFEEYGSETDHCGVERPWQQASLALATEGMGGDLFWQWGDQLSTGQTHNDGHTIYYGSRDATCLVSDHVKAIGST